MEEIPTYLVILLSGYSKILQIKSMSYSQASEHIHFTGPRGGKFAQGKEYYGLKIAKFI